MGGFFSQPAPQPLPPLPPLPVDNTAAEEEKRRLQNIARRRRGRAGAIATSAKGIRSLLATGSQNSKRKSLLGE
ncbi:MAG TPA: hypothetical protein ENI69_11545 [Rhodospirillales bacterium]|nr:hypothetical protein [Rhodospirillales bacterium]